MSLPEFEAPADAAYVAQPSATEAYVARWDDDTPCGRPLDGYDGDAALVIISEPYCTHYDIEDTIPDGFDIAEVRQNEDEAGVERAALSHYRRKGWDVLSTTLRGDADPGAWLDAVVAVDPSIGITAQVVAGDAARWLFGEVYEVTAYHLYQITKPFDSYRWMETDCIGQVYFGDNEPIEDQLVAIGRDGLEFPSVTKAHVLVPVLATAVLNG